MSFPRYPKYKDSGVEWLGDVPEHWEVMPLKYNLQLVTTKAEKGNNPVALENIESWTGRFIYSETEFEGTGIAFQKGDILFGKLRPYLAKVFLADIQGEGIGDFHVMRPRASLIPRFAQYQMLNREFISIIDGSTFGSKMPRASWEFLAALKCLLPPASEQSLIAKFLDTETQKIDELIAEQERLIELLKEKRQAVISHAVTKGLNPDAPMKPSGIEWLGDVPEHWYVTALKRGYTVILGKMHQEEQSSPSESLMPYLRAGNIDWDGIDLWEVKEMWLSEKEREFFRLVTGDLLVSEGGDVGRSCVWRAELQECFFQKSVNRIRPKNQNSNHYLWFWMQTIKASGFIDGLCNKATIAHLTAEKLAEIPVPFPPETEQLQICGYLDLEIARFKSLVNEGLIAISLLQERRTALISAAVTGQIDLRNYNKKESA